MSGGFITKPATYATAQSRLCTAERTVGSWEPDVIWGPVGMCSIFCVTEGLKLFRICGEGQRQ